jgi:hypothetical protein
MLNDVLILVRRLNTGDTAKALCCCIRLDSGIPTMYLPKSLITYTDDENLETVVLMPRWLAIRHKIEKYIIKEQVR